MLKLLKILKVSMSWLKIQMMVRSVLEQQGDNIQKRSRVICPNCQQATPTTTTQNCGINNVHNHIDGYSSQSTSQVLLLLYKTMYYDVQNLYQFSNVYQNLLQKLKYYDHITRTIYKNYKHKAFAHIRINVLKKI